jgi:uncharacterized damage-inducible protein DinB
MQSAMKYPAVIDALRRAPLIIIPMVQEAPAAILKKRPAPGKWSIHEHMCHLAHVHQLFMSRLDVMLRDPRPTIAPYFPDEQDADDFLLEMDLDEAMRRYDADREILVSRLERLNDADWERAADHDEYVRYSVLIMFRHLALHDFLHGYRIEQILLER